MQLEHRLSELAQRYNELSDEYGFTTNLTLQGDYTWPEDRELSESELKIKEFQALTSEIKGLLLSCKDNPRVFDLLYFHLREVAAVVKNRQCVIPQGIFTIDPKDFTPEILFVRNFAAYALAADYINGFQQH